MTSEQPRAYHALLLLSGIFSALAIVTLIPNASAVKPNVLGYRSVCSFAPAASAICGILAGITCVIRRRVVSNKAASARFQPPFIPVIVGLALITVTVVSWISFARAQSGFDTVIRSTKPAGAAFSGLADGTRSATASEGEVSATVEVTVASGRIERLTLKDGVNIEASLAETLFDAVKATQSSQVDAVSGATASSQVLLRAVEAAAAGK
jgi:uncharacterized protein with FMN-binding domain